VKAEFETIENTIDLLTYLAEDVSLGFDRWDSRYVRGPSLYFLVISKFQIDSVVDPLGMNHWPVERARALPADFTAAVRTAEDVAFDCDGAVLVAADGTFQRQMVRVRSATDDRAVDVPHASWMSAKHLSAIEASVRDEVLAAVTLSEETGRVTRFRDGAYDDYSREALGGRWRVDGSGTGSSGTHRIGDTS
jgi:diadenylate cyclase